MSNSNRFEDWEKMPGSTQLAFKTEWDKHIKDRSFTIQPLNMLVKVDKGAWTIIKAIWKASPVKPGLVTDAEFVTVGTYGADVKFELVMSKTGEAFAKLWMTKSLTTDDVKNLRLCYDIIMQGWHFYSTTVADKSTSIDSAECDKYKFTIESNGDITIANDKGDKVQTVKHHRNIDSKYLEDKIKDCGANDACLKYNLYIAGTGTRNGHEMIIDLPDSLALITDKGDDPPDEAAQIAHAIAILRRLKWWANPDSKKVFIFKDFTATDRNGEARNMLSQMVSEHKAVQAASDMIKTEQINIQMARDTHDVMIAGAKDASAKATTTAKDVLDKALANAAKMTNEVSKATAVQNANSTHTAKINQIANTYNEAVKAADDQLERDLVKPTTDLAAAEKLHKDATDAVDKILNKTDAEWATHMNDRLHLSHLGKLVKECYEKINKCSKLEDILKGPLATFGLTDLSTEQSALKLKPSMIPRGQQQQSSKFADLFLPRGPDGRPVRQLVIGSMYHSGGGDKESRNVTNLRHELAGLVVRLRNKGKQLSMDTSNEITAKLDNLSKIEQELVTLVDNLRQVVNKDLTGESNAALPLTLMQEINKKSDTQKRKMVTLNKAFATLHGYPFPPSAISITVNNAPATTSGTSLATSKHTFL